MPYAAFTAAAPADPAALLAQLPAANKLRGNRNLPLAPRRGARTGCPCHSAAIHGKPRCRAGQARGQAPHGERSPGPRTPESLQQQRPGVRLRVRDDRTIPRAIHGNDGATASADNRHRLTVLRVSPVDLALDRYQADLSPAPSANLPLQGAPTPGPTVPFKPSCTDPLNREPPAKPGSTVPFEPSRIDPLNREPGAFPDPDPHSVHRLRETPHIREPTRCAAHAEPAPQVRNYCRG